MKTTLSAAFCLLTATLPPLISEATGQTQGRVDIAGPLRVCAANPRYFADPTGHPAYLTGSHTWESLQDGMLSGYTTVTQPFDYTGYCLAKINPRDPQYLVYLPDAGPVTVDLSVTQANLAVEWFQPETGETSKGETVQGGGSVRFQTPFAAKDAVLYLCRME